MKLFFLVISLMIMIIVIMNSSAQDSHRIEKNANFHESIPPILKINYKEKRRYSANDNDTSLKYLNYIIKYDENGNEIEKKEIWVHNETIEQYEYDNMGKRISGIWKGTEFYDEYGNYIPGEIGKYIYEYDNKNNLILENKIDSNGDILETQLFKYDSNNRVIEYEQKSSFDSESDEKYQYLYNDDENSKESIYYYNGKKTRVDKYIFDTENQLIEKYDGININKEIFKLGYLFKYIYYYENDQLSEFKCYYGMNEIAFNYGVIFKYDSYGNLILEGSYHNDGEIEDYVIYEYLY